MTNSLDSDGTAHYEPSHLDLHCLQKYLSWSTGLKGLRGLYKLSVEITVNGVFLKSDHFFHSQWILCQTGFDMLKDTYKVTKVFPLLKYQV